MDNDDQPRPVRWWETHWPFYSGRRVRKRGGKRLRTTATQQEVARRAVDILSRDQHR